MRSYEDETKAPTKPHPSCETPASVEKASPHLGRWGNPPCYGCYGQMVTFEHVLTVQVRRVQILTHCRNSVAVTPYQNPGLEMS